MVKPNTNQKVSSKKDITIMERRRYITNEKEESKQENKQEEGGQE